VLSPVLDRRDMPVGTSLPATVAASIPPAATYRSLPHGVVTAEVFSVLEQELGTGSWLFTRPIDLSLFRTGAKGDLGRELVIDEAHHFPVLKLTQGSGKSDLFRVLLASSLIQEAAELSRLSMAMPAPGLAPAQEGHVLADPEAGVRAALDDLIESTGLSDDRLRQLLGAKSRSSFYNWLRGSTISSKFADQIMRLHRLVKPIRETRDRRLVAAWLENGDPSPAALVLAGRWDEVAALAEAAVRPAQAAVAPIVVAEEEEGEDEALLSLMHYALVPTTAGAKKRTDSRLREDTGLGDWSYEEE
jgi:hypothetical protein